MAKKFVVGDEQAVRFRVACEDAADRGRSRWAYLRFALANPLCIALLLAAAMVFGLETRSLVAALVAFGGLEVVLLGVVSRIRAFRRYADACFAQVARARAAEDRLVLLSQMGSEHGRELHRLEALVDRMWRLAPDRPGLPVVVEECCRLLGTYVGLSIAYNRGGQVLASTDRRALDDDVRALEVTRPSSTRQVRVLADQRAAIARRRAERWDRSHATLDGITQQLAMIGELVQLTHEQVLAPVDPRDATFEVDRILAQLAESRPVVDEFLVVEDDVEPRVVAMGRAAMV